MTTTTTAPPSRQRRWKRRIGTPSWLGLFFWALFLRVAAADLVQWAADRKHVLCLFPDTTIYWGLASKIVDGEPFEVTFFGDLPHFALRTPGYPLFLAICQWLFGTRTLPARLIQALLGAACVPMVAWLVRRAWTFDSSDPQARSVPFLAAFLTAIDPFVVSNSAFLLSEALFLPLMLVAQWAFAGLWTAGDLDSGSKLQRFGWALLAGIATGAAVLVRPSWALYLPLLLLAWLIFGSGLVRQRLLGSLVVVVGLIAIMSPWWARNAAIYGKFVPTALWMGASLYDGISPQANGASNMDFLNDPDVWPLDEEQQDDLLKQRAIAFALQKPGRVATLALIKAGRFWSPWPNAESFQSKGVAIVSALLVVPIFGLTAYGLALSRRDPRALILLALPLLYTFALHLVFVSSMRYRIPVFVPAFGFTAIALARWLPERRRVETSDSRSLS